MRLAGLFVGLAILFLIPFLIWGSWFESLFSLEGSVAWLGQFGSWAWLAGIGLLLSDILLPMPGTLVMSAMGYVYGPVVGGIIASLGSFLSGLVGYGMCRLVGEPAARRILGPDGYQKGIDLFDRIGGWMVVMSRWLPLFPEVVACMAGLIRMRFGTFAVALACGSIPLGFAFAWIGHLGTESPVVALVLSAVLPPLLWFVTSRLMVRSTPSD